MVGQYSHYLLADTLFIMAGLGLVNQVSENIFAPNGITRHMVDNPGATHGALHLFVIPPESNSSTHC